MTQLNRFRMILICISKLSFKGTKRGKMPSDFLHAGAPLQNNKFPFYCFHPCLSNILSPPLTAGITVGTLFSNTSTRPGDVLPLHLREEPEMMRLLINLGNSGGLAQPHTHTDNTHTHTDNTEGRGRQGAQRENTEQHLG